jgi:ribosome biogenesis GTPase
MPPSNEQEALIVATFSRRMTLLLANGKKVRARIKGRRLEPVCGDRVNAKPIDNELEWLITCVLPRTNELARPNTHGKALVLAANLNFLAIVTADPQTPDWFIVDRYLCAAELMGVPAVIIFNKIDLTTPSAMSSDTLKDYKSIGYETVLCSAKSGSNLHTLLDLFANQTAIIVGQSGVGKSSLINRLAENAYQPTATVSKGSGEGRHTTVNSVMLKLPNGGAVIDSPGVRDYVPNTGNADDVIQGFREIRDLGVDCKFSNCRHFHEPDCAVKIAIKTGVINERRYESYKRLLVFTNKLTEKKY